MLEPQAGSLSHGKRLGSASPSLTRHLIAFCVVLLLGSTTFAADTAWSVEFLNSRKAEWDQLVGPTIKIEGRITLYGKTQLKLAKCDLVFTGSEATIKSIVRKGAAEITGRLKRDNNKLSFEVDRVEALPSDIDQYELKAVRLRNPKPEEWYVLGDWATERSQFYDDAELAKRALSAYEHGISAGVRNLAADDAKGRFELAGKVTRYKLPDARRMELMHEGYRILFNTTSKSPQSSPADWKQLANQIVNDLPGSTQSLAKMPDELKAKYEENPLAVYRDAAEAVRLQLHRLLYIAVVLKPILAEAAQDGGNGDVIADRIDQQAPEAKTLIEQYRDAKLAWRLERAATITRAEIEQLSTDLVSRKRPELARQAVDKWLKAREPRLRKDGVLGLLQLADERWALLRDEPKTVEALLEAYKRDPSFKDVHERFRTLGYGQVAGSWVKGATEMPIQAPIQVDANTGIIRIGMTATQLAATNGRAGSIARLYSKQGVVEVWTYQPIGTSRIVVRLERSSTATEATVVEVSSE